MHGWETACILGSSIFKLCAYICELPGYSSKCALQGGKRFWWSTLSIRHPNTSVRGDDWAFAEKTLMDILGFWASADRDLPGCPVIPRFGCWDYVWSTSFFWGDYVWSTSSIFSFRNIWPKPRSSKKHIPFMVLQYHPLHTPPMVLPHGLSFLTTKSWLPCDPLRKYVPFQSLSSILSFFAIHQQIDMSEHMHVEI